MNTPSGRFDILSSTGRLLAAFRYAGNDLRAEQQAKARVVNLNHSGSYIKETVNATYGKEST